MTDLLSQVKIDGDGIIDFISDLHLQSSEESTYNAWASYMRETPATAMFILGDFFEVWAGDDVIDNPVGEFEAECIKILKSFSQNRNLYFMAGNRDFLLQKHALESSGMKALADPCLLQVQDQKFVLSHGDAMCLTDVEYLKFRQMVRDELWQSQFLAQPLDARLAVAKAMRQKSEEEKSKHRSAFENSIQSDSANSSDSKSQNESFMGLHDVDTEYASSILEALGCETLIHGHTHRPGDYGLLGNKKRIVLSDWDASSTPKRLEVLRLQSGELKRIKLWIFN